MNRYVGLRYVPKHCGDWDNTKNTAYEFNSVVYYGGNSYTAKKDVRIGIDILNETFWGHSADYNEQLSIYQNGVNNQLSEMNKNNQDFQTSLDTNNTSFQHNVNTQLETFDTTKPNDIDNTRTTTAKTTTGAINELNLIKANKTDVFSMDNMGTDVKLAMTGGAVPVVGSGSVAFENLKSTIQDDLGTWTPQNPISPMSNGFPNITNNVITDYGTQTYWWHSIFACSVGQRWKLTFETNANTSITGYVYAIDSTGKIITQWYAGTNIATLVSDYEITIPQNATSIVIISSLSNTLSAKLIVYNTIATLKYVDEQTKDLPDIATNVSTNNVQLTKLLNSSFINGQAPVVYTSTDGYSLTYNSNTKVANANNTVVEFACAANEVYQLKGLLSGTNQSYAIQFYDNNDNVVATMTDLTNQNGSISVIAPVGATKCRYTQWLNHNYLGVYQYNLKTEFADNLYVWFTNGTYPTFTVGANYSLIVTLPTANKFIVSHSREEQINYDNTNNVYTVPNNQILAYNLITKKFDIDTYDNLINTNPNYICLVCNSYGHVAFGQWKPYYDNQVLNGTITTTQNNINSVSAALASVDTKYDSVYDTNNYIEDKISAINTLQSKYLKGDILAFITDLHINDNFMTSFKLLKEVCKKTGMNKIVCGGDLPTAYGTKEQMYDMTYKSINALYDNCDYSKLYMLRGNHDLTINDTANSTGYTATEAEMYNAFMRRQETYVNKDNNKLYYYFDNTNEKIRYICLDTSDGNIQYGTNTAWGVPYGVSQEQVNWILNTALNIINEDGWTVVFFGHIPVNAGLNSYGGGTLASIDAILKALKNKTSCVYSDGTITINFNFATSKAELVGYICGHNHMDDNCVDNNVLYLSTLCDARYQDSGITRTQGTTSAGAFDIITLNTETKTLNLTRIGAGSDRVFNY
jgi:hypothetical protein